MNKPVCPGCGKEMKPYGTIKAYRCYCGWRSPAKSTEDEAYAAAMRRYDEPLKPLKLHEVTGSEEPCVFLETRRYPQIKACDCVISADCRHVDVMMIGTYEPWVVPISEYGKSWRCWARCPTDAEREAVKWE